MPIKKKSPTYLLLTGLDSGSDLRKWFAHLFIYFYEDVMLSICRFVMAIIWKFSCTFKLFIV